MVRLLEHRSLALLAGAGVTVPPHEVAATADAAAEAARRLGGAVMIKALVPRGGRAKAGAVVRADDPEAAAEAAHHLLGESVGAFPVREVLVQLGSQSAASALRRSPSTAWHAVRWCSYRPLGASTSRTL